MIYGYARVSTKGQAKDGNSLEYQEEELKKAGASKIFQESFTGTKTNRPVLDKLLKQLNDGDTVVVTKLDRIARNAKSGLELIDQILDKGCSIRILNMGMFDTTPTGKLMRTVMLAQSIKRHCKQCSGGSSQEAKKCPNMNCDLWRYRTGREEKDDLYIKTKRNRNFDTINSKRKFNHINDAQYINTI